jgi:uncharacterized membrane protein
VPPARVGPADGPADGLPEVRRRSRSIGRCGRGPYSDERGGGGRHDRDMTTSARSGWLIPTGLIALSLVPVLAGSLRLVGLAGGAQVIPDHDRVAAGAVPVAIHIVSVTVYCLLGAFQFSPSLRRRRIGWHRAAGRLLVPCGLAAALSGMWLTLFLPRAAIDGDVLAGIRIVVGTAMTLAILRGLAAVLRRDIARHRAWMIRGYALGLGAGTQAFTQLPWMVFVGPLDEVSKTWLMAAAWLINIGVAEWIIRSGSGASVRPGAHAAGGGTGIAAPGEPSPDRTGRNVPAAHDLLEGRVDGEDPAQRGAGGVRAGQEQLVVDGQGEVVRRGHHALPVDTQRQ